MIVFNSLLKQGLLSIDESTLAYENGKLTAKISMGSYTEVETLPSIADAKEGITYLVPTDDYFTMYVVDKTNAKWITLGTTANKSYEFGDGLVESNGVVTLDEKPKAIRDYFVNVDKWGAVVPYLAIQDTLDVVGDITTESALKGETLEIGSTIGVDSVGLYDTRTTYPEDGKYVVTKYLLEERIKDLTLSVPTNVSQLNNDMQYSTVTQVGMYVAQSINQCVLKNGSTMTGALTINNDLKALPLGFTTSMGVPAYGLQVSSTYGLQLFGTHFLNGTLWGDDGLKIVSNNLSLNTLDEAFISSDYANTTTFRAMPNDGTQATYKFEGWGWDDVSHTTKSPRLGVRLLKPNQATTLESTSVLNMSEGDNRWVSLNGGTMTGYLNIPSPTSSSHPTTKSYVDNLVASSGGGNEFDSIKVATSVQMPYTSTNDYRDIIKRNSSTLFVGRNIGSTSSGGNGDNSIEFNTNYGPRIHRDTNIITFPYQSGVVVVDSGLKTINGESLVGSGDITIGGGGGGGLENLATGEYSLSILGIATTSDGSTTIGYNANASGLLSTALGAFTNASGQNSSALGYKATASQYNSTALGTSATASGNGSTAFGYRATASGMNANAFGSFSSATGNISFAFGASAQASGYASTALGNGAEARDNGLTAISAWDDNYEVRTQLYLIGAGSTLSTTYCDGEAGLGFTSYDGDGNIKRGTIKLSALCTENTDTFEPS